MPRRARIKLPGTPFHITQRGINRMVCFPDVHDFQQYLAWLTAHAEETCCQIHAYVLMSNHIHLLLSASQGDGPSLLMKKQNQRYAQYFNRRYERTGGLWEGRFYSCPVQTSHYFLVCQRYIELNPVRAGMVTHPAHYAWSSHRANAQAESNPVVTPHRMYLELGQTPINRLAAYRQLFKAEIEPEQLTEIRRATHNNYALGNDHFIAEISAATGRPCNPRKPGRPGKPGTYPFSKPGTYPF